MPEYLPKSFTWKTCSCLSSLANKESQRPERYKFLSFHYIQVGNWVSSLRHSNSVWGTIILLLNIEIRTQPTLLIIQQLSQIAQLPPLGNKIETHFANVLGALPFDSDRNRLTKAFLTIHLYLSCYFYRVSIASITLSETCLTIGTLYQWLPHQL
jgi:hypothetical protein